MRTKVLSLLLIASSLVTMRANAQCDPWIVKIYSESFGRNPDATECSIYNYNNGSWNSYDQLKSYIIAYNKKKGSTAADYQAAGRCGNSGYYGMCAITEFTNNDFPVTNTTCGQAAAVTALWQAGLKATADPNKLVSNFYKTTPPKITVPGIIEIKGTLGTDWRQLNSGLDLYKSQGIRYNWQKGTDALKTELRKGIPCLIMLDTGTMPQHGFKWFTGHWVVAYGYDASYVYVTNFPNNRMTWEELKKGWGGSLTEGHMAKAHGTGEMFAAVWKQ